MGKRVAARWHTNGKECWQLVNNLPHPKNVPSIEEILEDYDGPMLTKMLEELPIHYADEIYPNKINKINKIHNNVSYYILEENMNI